MSDVETWVREAVHRLEEQMKELTGSVADVRERLIRMEATALHGTVETLEAKIEAFSARVALLEADRHARQETGKTVGKVAEWVHKLGPWLFAAAFVVFQSWRQV